MKLRKDLAYIKKVRSKGRTYEYFDTGVNARGKRVLKRLPPRSSIDFGQVYAGYLAHRTARINAKPSPTIRDLIREYELSPAFTKKAASTQETYGVYLRLIASTIGMAPVNAVERKDVNRLLATMEKRPSAANMTRLVLSNMFKLAKRREWIAKSPTDDIDLMETEDADYEPWPDDLLGKGLADARYSVAVALLYYTGQRIGDVCKMRWADIQDDGTIYVKQQKTGKEVWPPLHSDLVAILEAAERAGETILTGRNGAPRRKATLRYQLQKWAGEHGEEIVPHGLRKNAVIALLEAGATLIEVSSITGQSLRIVEHYAKRFNARRIAHSAMEKWDGTKRADRNGIGKLLLKAAG